MHVSADDFSQHYHSHAASPQQVEFKPATHQEETKRPLWRSKCIGFIEEMKV